MGERKKMAVSGRRKRMLIEPYKQLRFGVIFLLVNVFFTVLMVSVFGYYMWDMFVAIRTFFLMSGNEHMITWQKFMVPASVGLIIAVSFIATTLYLSVRYTHQFYGPMVSIQRFLDQMLADEKPSSIALRKGDQLQELVARLNSIAQKLEEE